MAMPSPCVCSSLCYTSCLFLLFFCSFRPLVFPFPFSVFFPWPTDHFAYFAASRILKRRSHRIITHARFEPFSPLLELLRPYGNLLLLLILLLFLLRLLLRLLRHRLLLLLLRRLLRLFLHLLLRLFLLLFLLSRRFRSLLFFSFSLPQLLRLL